MKKVYYIDKLKENQEFLFKRLELNGIDNTPVKKILGSEITAQEISLFHGHVSCGDNYFELFDRFYLKGY